MTAPLPIAPGVDLAACIRSYPRQWSGLDPNLVKIEEDLLRYRQVIIGTGPDVVIECGTWRGASAAYFSDLGVPHVFTIDVEDHYWPVPYGRPTHVSRVIGDSVSERVVSMVAGMIEPGQAVMVVLDSDHSPEHVLQEMAAYGPLVTPGCYMVVEDGICRHVPGTPVTDAGPLDAIEAWVEMGGADGWERDLVIEGLYPETHHLAGWWRKAEP